MLLIFPKTHIKDRCKLLIKQTAAGPHTVNKEGGMERRVVRLVRKVCLLGDPGVGKTSLIRMHLSGTFDPEQRSTVGTSVSRRTVVLDFPEKGLEVHLRLSLWDITGHVNHPRFRRAYLRGAHGALVVADASRPETLPGTIDWLDELRAEAGNVPAVLVVNKMDIFEKGALDVELLRDICAGFGCELRLASARTGRSVNGTFNRLFRRLAWTAVDEFSRGGSKWGMCA